MSCGTVGVSDGLDVEKPGGTLPRGERPNQKWRWESLAVQGDVGVVLSKGRVSGKDK